MIFKESAVAILNKVDILPYCNFDMESAREDISALHPGMTILETSCTTGQGIEPWCEWLRQRVEEKQNR